MAENREASKRTAGSYIAAVVANAVILFLVNKAQDWNLRFLTDSYPAVLWALNVSLLVQIAGNALLLFFHPRFLHYLGQTIFNVVTLLATIILASVFPFDFSFLAGVLNTIARIALIIAAVATAISVVVNLMKAVGSLISRAE